MSEPFAHGFTLREEGQVELLGETPNGLSARVILAGAERQCQYWLLQNLVRRHLIFWQGIALHGQYRRSDRQLAASLESPLIYNELHERIAFAIRSIIQWNCSDRNLRRVSH